MHSHKTCLSALLAALSAGSVYAQYALAPFWTLAPGDRSYLPATGDNAQRGMGFNPATSHLLLASRTGGNFVHILDAHTGADLGTLSTAGIAGGTFAINMLRVADDGAIFAANLTTDSSSASPGPLKIYRWENESATPTVIYSGDPSAVDASATNRRFGDNFDVRGSGTGTQILLGSRNGTVAAIIGTADGTTWTSTKLTATDGAATAAGSMGLGVSFGNGNTFYGDSTGSITTRQFSFDLGTGGLATAVNYSTVQTGMGPIGFDTANNLLAGIQLIASPTPDAVLLYDLSGGSAVLQSTYNYPTDRANANAVGSVEFVGSRLYVLNANNGIIAFNVVPEPGTVALWTLGAAAMAAASRRKFLRK